jgi:hypothetical protein
MNATIITDELFLRLARRFGKGRQLAKSQVYAFGDMLSCSISYSKLLPSHKYFFAVPSGMLGDAGQLPKTKFGEFALFICGSAETVLVIPRAIILEMLQNVPTRRVDIFYDSGCYVLQTTKHPKLNVTEFLNAFPSAQAKEPPASTTDEAPAESEQTKRIHVRMQWSLIQLGIAEGRKVWVPVNDRNLSYKGHAFAECTLHKLPNSGFEENSRRIVQNIDVLWLENKVIRKAFEIESTTSIYSGLLRLNDLVLAQPNNNIDLYVAASGKKRSRVCDQLVRPSFQSLLPLCRFITFEEIEEQAKRIESLSLGKGVRISGLIEGERFRLPENLVYPDPV